ncbi:isoleucine--tRNA ligase [bacterium BMS3Bbin04]|nr:isoleucine--tRNA ligase [bacterium BMS3Bbin04]
MPEALDSIHLEKWPEADDSLRDDKLKASMDYARAVVSVGRAAREIARLKVRQPLAKLILVAEETQREMLKDLQELILDELNVREIEFADSANELITFHAKPNFPALGPRFGKDVKIWAPRIMQATPDMTASWADGDTVVLEGETFGPDDVVLSQEAPEHLVVNEDGEVLLALDKRLSDDLRAEGLVRELINRIQNRRKDRQFEVTQRIELKICAEEEMRVAVEKHLALIEREVLAIRIVVQELGESNDKIDVNGNAVQLYIEPVPSESVE